MIGTVEDNVKKVEDTITTPYLFTGTREWNKLMNASKFDGRFTFDTVSDALEMAFYCGFVNGHVATMKGEYKEKRTDNDE